MPCDRDKTWFEQTPAEKRATQAARAATRLLAQTLMQGNSTANLKVEGNCMMPLVQNGDEIIVSSLEDHLKVGALVVAESSDRVFLCHRILEVMPSGEVLLAGDRSRVAEKLHRDHLIGLVQEIRREGYCMRLHTPFGTVVDKAIADLHSTALRYSGSPHRHSRLLARMLMIAVKFLAWFRANI